MKLKRDLNYVEFNDNSDEVVVALESYGLKATVYDNGGAIEVEGENYMVEMRRGEVLVVLTNNLALYMDREDFLKDFEL